VADNAESAEAASPPASRSRPAHNQDSGFGDWLAGCVQRRRSQIVLGLDPDPARLWPDALELAGGMEGSPAQRAGRAVAAHCRLVLDAAAQQCVAVKPQVACFERLGAPGWSALGEVMEDAAQRGLVVIADAKRGDIDISARAYAQAFFGRTPTPFGDVEGLAADALTVSPLLGRDSLAPFVEAARDRGAGLFVLARTSNPGAEDIQDRELADGGSVSGAIARMIDELGRPGVGATGLSDVGAVTGATAPDRMEALRELMPNAVWLLPGIGAQGGSGRELAPAFAPGPAGGLVSASRAIVYAYESTGGATPAAAARTEATRLRELVWGLYA
jgi:orotidine-5'-phosphate decarboxylase